MIAAPGGLAVAINIGTPGLLLPGRISPPGINIPIEIGDTFIGLISKIANAGNISVPVQISTPRVVKVPTAWSPVTPPSGSTWTDEPAASQLNWQNT